jgi:diadenosine tetraphosphatase ApaH/serine/threonine PP2A family protein phosphatase
MHGNAIALDVVLSELDRDSTVDEIVCLGDVAQGGAQPAEVVDHLRELGCRCVFGNSDEFLLTLDPSGEDLDAEQLERLLAVGRWSRERLGPERLEFLRGFAPTVELDLDGLSVMCCHASPRSNEEIVIPQTPREEVRRLIGDADAVAGGHVHRQWLDRFGSKVWIGVGSVGLAYDFNEPLNDTPFLPHAEYAIVGDAHGELGVDFRRVRYDGHDVVRAVRASGMPYAERFAGQWQLS